MFSFFLFFFSWNGWNKINLFFPSQIQISRNGCRDEVKCEAAASPQGQESVEVVQTPPSGASQDSPGRRTRTEAGLDFLPSSTKLLRTVGGKKVSIDGGISFNFAIYCSNSLVDHSASPPNLGLSCVCMEQRTTRWLQLTEIFIMGRLGPSCRWTDPVFRAEPLWYRGSEGHLLD